MFRDSAADFFISIAYWTLRKIGGPFVRALLVKKVTGLHHIPKKGPAVIAFNHQSYFDFFCFLAVTPRNVHFLVAEKFFASRLWRPLMKMTGQIHVDRNAKDKQPVHNAVHDNLRKGRIIGIFPEGTRAKSAQETEKAFTGAAKYAMESHAPIIPIGIKGTYDIMSRHGTKPHVRKIAEMHIGKPIHLEEYHTKKAGPEAHEEITHRLMLTISRLSEKSYPHAPSHLVHFPHE